jgi:hypothetical protein
MKLRHRYLIIAVLGTVVPYLFFLQFLLENGLDLVLFAEQMLGTEIAAFFTWDVVISTLAVLTLIFTEGRRLQMKNLWLYVVFNLLVGVSLALPAFLYARQKQLDQAVRINSTHV